MNNGPGILMIALTIVWVALLFQRRTAPKIVVGGVLIILQVFFMGVVLDSAYLHAEDVDLQDRFLNKTRKSLLLGDHKTVLKAVQAALERDSKATSGDRLSKAIQVLDQRIETSAPAP